MIDVHVLIRENPNPEHLQRCLDSLKNQPITIHTLPGVMGHIGKGRIAGYSRGNNPWCCHVDDDDSVKPETFTYFTHLIRAHPYLACIYAPVTLKPIQQEPATRIMPLRNLLILGDHFVLYRRELLAPLLDLYENRPFGGDFFVSSAFRETYQDMYMAMTRPFYCWRSTCPG